MRAVFSSLVTASLLIHAMIGCCWHHGHAASSCCEAPAAPIAETGCHDHHSHDCCGDEHGQPPTAPCDRHSHCHIVCSYLPVQKSQLDKVQFHVSLEFAAIAPSSCDVQVTALNRLERVHESAAGPPLRLHLWHQILLI